MTIFPSLEHPTHWDTRLGRGVVKQATERWLLHGRGKISSDTAISRHLSITGASPRSITPEHHTGASPTFLRHFAGTRTGEAIIIRHPGLVHGLLSHVC